MYYINQLESMSRDEKYIFSIIQKGGLITKNDLSLITKMKLTTWNRVMQPMIKRGLIIETGKGI